MNASLGRPLRGAAERGVDMERCECRDCIARRSQRRPPRILCKRGRNAEWGRQLKLRVIKEYGGACSCCGEAIVSFLTIDHVNGGGNAHRRKLKLRGAMFYRWLAKKGFPKGEYRLLWFICNQGRALNNGTCPHLLLQSSVV